MSYLLCTLLIVVGCVCFINMSNLNLTEKEENLLYVKDDENDMDSKKDIKEEQPDFEDDFNLDDIKNSFDSDNIGNPLDDSFVDFDKDFANDFDQNLDKTIENAVNDLGDICDDMDNKSMTDAAALQKEVYEKGKH